MPGGPSLLGVAYFSAIKLAGYSFAGHYLNKQEKVDTPTPFKFGAGRTALGVIVGVPYALTVGSLFPDLAMPLFLLGLVPIRLGEWIAMIWIAYRTGSGPWTRRWKYAAQGMVWSFALDAPAIGAAFVLPGGFWIC